MIDNTEQEYLNKLLIHCQQQQRYYLAMAVIIIGLSWFLFFALRRSGALIIAVILSVGLWYYPWRYFQRAKLLLLDIQSKEKITITTTVYAKNISKINRLQPYYYCYTEEEDFEISESLYKSIEIPLNATIVYTPNSKTILSIVPSHSNS